MTKRRLTSEEKKLWKYVVRDTTPLSAVLAEDNHEEPVKKSPAKPEIRRYKSHSVAAVAKPKAKPPAALKRGDYAGLDGSTAQRFRKGDYPIDATLDLHGMTQAQAHAALARFLHKQYERGSRALLIITGKGLRKSEGGVLRGMLPHWLEDEALRPMILAFDVAKPKHGGEGAFYILLKRKRI